MLHRLEQPGLRLLLEPWQAHVLGDEVPTAAMCERFGGTVGVVLDIANFIRPAEWGHRAERAASIGQTLGPQAGAVHLTDITVCSGGEISLPCFGGGELDAATPLAAVRRLVGSVPAVIEHVIGAAETQQAVNAVCRAARDIDL